MCSANCREKRLMLYNPIASIAETTDEAHHSLGNGAIEAVLGVVGDKAEWYYVEHGRVLYHIMYRW